MDLFWTTLVTTGGSALGALVGTFVFWGLRLQYAKMRSKPTVLREYLCSSPQNLGDEHETPGELMHHHGKRLADNAELQKLGVSHPVWEWTPDKCGVGSGYAVIFGPYSTDFADPGGYSAVFRIRAKGITAPEEIVRDLILLELDVNQTVSRFIPQGPTGTKFPDQQVAARRFIRASELGTKDWQEFELNFMSDCQGLWEFRIHAYDGTGKQPNRIGEFGANVRIFFDTVEVRKINRLQLPWD